MAHPRCARWGEEVGGKESRLGPSRGSSPLRPSHVSSPLRSSVTLFLFSVCHCTFLEGSSSRGGTGYTDADVDAWQAHAAAHTSPSVNQHLIGMATG
eukprot:363791-Chlamydomonas_euryale.AAC.1